MTENNEEIIKKILRPTTEAGTYHFWCVGCQMAHGFHKGWTLTGTLDKPTVSPSLLTKYNGADKEIVCHLFIVNGELQYLSDCTHELAGKTIPMEAF